jgi:hypothetical protein
LGLCWGVYGPIIDAFRSSLWDELAGLSSWELPWCIGDNFNVTRFLAERLRDVRLNAAMLEFSDFIFEQGLMDIPLAKGSFTWFNNQENPSWSHELISFFFYSLYSWTTAFLAPFVISFNDFFILFSSS